MTDLEILKQKRKAALIVMLTLGLAAVPMGLMAPDDLFDVSSFTEGVFKIILIVCLTLLVAIPAFVIYTITFIVTSIKIAKY